MTRAREGRWVFQICPPYDCTRLCNGGVGALHDSGYDPWRGRFRGKGLFGFFGFFGFLSFMGTWASRGAGMDCKMRAYQG